MSGTCAYVKHTRLKKGKRIARKKKITETQSRSYRGKEITKGNEKWRRSKKKFRKEERRKIERERERKYGWRAGGSVLITTITKS